MRFTLLALAALSVSVATTVAEAGPKGCPPGLAKKGSDCLPPGQAKKRYGGSANGYSDDAYRDGYRDGFRHGYRVGDRIERDYVVLRDPYRYGLDTRGTYWRVGDSVFRVDQRTGEILAVIGLLSSLMN